MVWDILDEVIAEHPVLLNRAPTLHRLGIQAFEVILNSGRAIQLHPLVCMAFNADFDGDQMAVHVPISIEAQLEARVLMMSTNNILSPASGAPMIVASLDIVLGLHYLTRENPAAIGANRFYSGFNEVLLAWQEQKTDIHAPIKVLAEDCEEVIATTVGRVLLFQNIAEYVSFQSINQVLDKKSIAKLIDNTYREKGPKDTVILADKLMYTGFRHATKSGVSVCIKDFEVPTEKPAIINKAKDNIKLLEDDYAAGRTTLEEKYNKAVDVWSRANDAISEAMTRSLGKEVVEVAGKKQEIDSFNSIYMMASSGARGSAAQIRQLAGMRGLMAKPDGSIIETPIISNFREGLTMNEYFISTHGARKGLADTALKTANSGYLTRRLVDVAQDVVVSEDDCGTTDGVTIASVVEGKNLIMSLKDRIVGRYTAEDIFQDDTLIVSAGTYIEQSVAEKIDQAGIQEISVRSPVSCKSLKGVCIKCYGIDLARGRPVNKGEAVGIVAAQSIGEPGTQLTMRTFHIGGAASQGTVIDSITIRTNGKVFFRNAKFIDMASSGKKVITSRTASVILVDANGKQREHHKIPYGSVVTVEDGSTVESGQKIVSWDPHSVPIIAEASGKLEFVEFVDGSTISEKVDELTGISSLQIIPMSNRPASAKKLKPQIHIVSDETSESQAEDATNIYHLSDNATLNVQDGQEILAGQVLARVPQESVKTKDITGGLPRVADLFEARKPKDPSVIIPLTGRVTNIREMKDNYKLTITAEDESKVDLTVSKWKQINIFNGMSVEKGEVLAEGEKDPHDLLKVLGVDALTNYLVSEIQNVYRMQGVVINDKHIEVIIRQMLRKVEVVESGDSSFTKGEKADYKSLIQENEKLIEQEKRPAVYVRELLGITKASLMTESFISAASFQETTRVLTEAAINGFEDSLVGLKENVIIGQLIPAGTGYYYHNKRTTEMKERELMSQKAQSLSLSFKSMLEEEKDLMSNRFQMQSDN